LKQVATTIFKFRLHVLIFLTLVTLFLGVHAANLKVATDFTKLVPQEHEYMKNYRPFKKLFGGGNQIRVSVSRREKTILDADFLKKFREINEDVFFVKGIDRRTVRSMVSPETLVVIINEEGFNVGPVVPHIIPETEEGLAKIEKNINVGGLKGRLVGMDMKSALISGEIYETGVDYLSIYRQLNQIREKYSDDDVTVHINGFAMVAGFVNDALPKIVLLFGLSILITFVVLYRCFRYLRLALLPLFSGGLSVLYALGITELMGLSLDPMTTIIPFLIFAIGASHGIQMVKRYLEECVVHAEGYDAALHALAGLMVPGTVALVTDAIGFLTILFVPIGVIHELALTSAIGVACVIVANILVLTLILSFFPNLMPAESEEAESRTVAYVRRLLDSVSRLTYGRNAYWVAGVSAVLLLIGLFSSRTMTVGDVNPGEPLLWEDSVYNLDAADMMKDYLFGIDVLSVVVAGDEPGVCKRYDILQTMEAYEEEIGNIPGVTVVISGMLLAKMVNQTFHEGDIRWRALPQTPMDLAWVMTYAGSTDESVFMNMGCQCMNIMVFLSDHKGDTIRRVIKKSKAFIAAHPMSGARLLLAGGNAGVMASTNEVVGEAQVPMLLLIYLSIFVLCLLMFRNLKAPLFIIAPLFVVSVIATAFMKAVGLGLNVNTLPVAALGVGIGVDYGIYFYSRLKEEKEKQDCFADAVSVTLQTTGAAVLYTALTLSAGVFTWLLSDLKFQADMGLLLGFIFLANMVGAMILLPALVYIFDVKDKKGNEIEDGEETISH
jgi:predicted RND superfamily exporter protein